MLDGCQLVKKLKTKKKKPKKTLQSGNQNGEKVHKCPCNRLPGVDLIFF
jgi:hypothetical protein